MVPRKYAAAHIDMEQSPDKDSRIEYATGHLKEALIHSLPWSAEYRRKMLVVLGKGLHSLQDIFAHEIGKKKHFSRQLYPVYKSLLHDYPFVGAGGRENTQRLWLTAQASRGYLREFKERYSALNKTPMPQLKMRIAEIELPDELFMGAIIINNRFLGDDRLNFLVSDMVNRVLYGIVYHKSYAERVQFILNEAGTKGGQVQITVVKGLRMLLSDDHISRNQLFNKLNWLSVPSEVRAKEKRF